MKAKKIIWRVSFVFTRMMPVQRPSPISRPQIVRNTYSREFTRTPPEGVSVARRIGSTTIYKRTSPSVIRKPLQTAPTRQKAVFQRSSTTETLQAPIILNSQLGTKESDTAVSSASSTVISMPLLSEDDASNDNVVVIILISYFLNQSDCVNWPV